MTARNSCGSLTSRTTGSKEHHYTQHITHTSIPTSDRARSLWIGQSSCSAQNIFSYTTEAWHLCNSTNLLVATNRIM